VLSLAYRFEPGAPEDGVSVVVPLPLLAALRPDGFDWQVPGLRAELVTALLRCRRRSAGTWCPRPTGRRSSATTCAEPVPKHNDGLPAQTLTALWRAASSASRTSP
jgi:ATP-dependent helicase HrpA